jgi:hypothetical protein
MKRTGLLIAALVFLFWPANGQAGNSIGIYCWNLSPSVDIVCFHIEDRGGFAMSLVGWDHIHTLSTDVHYPLSGAATFDSSANIYRLQWDVRVYHATTPVFYSFAASIDTTTLNGKWAQDALLGNNGDFLFVGLGPQ